MKPVLQHVAFWWTGYVILMELVDAVLPGFIPSDAYVLPFGVIGIGAIALLGWKKWRTGETKSFRWGDTAWWAISVALLGGVVYNVYEIAELPRTIFVAAFIGIFIISGAILLYERSHSRRGQSDAA